MRLENFLNMMIDKKLPINVYDITGGGMKKFEVCENCLWYFVLPKFLMDYEVEYFSLNFDSMSIAVKSANELHEQIDKLTEQIFCEAIENLNKDMYCYLYTLDDGKNIEITRTSNKYGTFTISLLCSVNEWDESASVYRKNKSPIIHSWTVQRNENFKDVIKSILENYRVQ